MPVGGSAVTKSGTNSFQGSGFSLFRDQAMNAETETEKLTAIDKQDYRRYQYGGSFGGPILLNRAHFFAAAERTQLDTRQSVDTSGLFPEDDGIFTTPIRENLLTAKGTMNLTPAHYVAVRYGRNTNSQPYGAGPTATVNNFWVYAVPPSGSDLRRRTSRGTRTLLRIPPSSSS